MIIPAKSQFNWLKWFLTRRFLKFQPMRTHYGPWQPCWISNQHLKHKYGRGPSSEHFWQVWLKSVQRFQRRRFKCEKLTDGRTTDAYPWQKLTWPMARWAKKNICRKEKGKSMWLRMAACTSCHKILNCQNIKYCIARTYNTVSSEQFQNIIEKS